MSSNSTSTPAKSSRCNSRPIIQNQEKSAHNYQCNNDKRHYRNTPNNEPIQKHRRSTSFQDHLAKTAHQSPSRSNSTTLSNSSSKQTHAIIKKNNRANDLVDHDPTFQQHNFPTPNEETIRSFNYGHPYSYDKQTWQKMIKISFGDNVPFGVPDNIFNNPDPPDLTVSKIISAIHVYTIIKKYYESTKSTNEKLDRFQTFFDISYIKLFLAALPHCIPLTMNFDHDITGHQ